MMSTMLTALLTGATSDDSRAWNERHGKCSLENLLSHMHLLSLTRCLICPLIALVWRIEKTQHAGAHCHFDLPTRFSPLRLFHMCLRLFDHFNVWRILCIKIWLTSPPLHFETAITWILAGKQQETLGLINKRPQCTQSLLTHALIHNIPQDNPL